MRTSGWLPRLVAEFDAAHGRRFRWGRHDCCEFTARCARAVTGYDYRHLFPVYRTRTHAEAILAEHGGMRGLLTRAFGEPVEPAHAKQGDIVLVDLVNGEQPAVCMGPFSYAPGRRNLVKVETLKARAAWML